VGLSLKTNKKYKILIDLCTKLIEVFHRGVLNLKRRRVGKEREENIINKTAKFCLGKNILSM